jgi:hypothetical protein
MVLQGGIERQERIRYLGIQQKSIERADQSSVCRYYLVSGLRAQGRLLFDNRVV